MITRSPWLKWWWLQWWQWWIHLMIRSSSAKSRPTLSIPSIWSSGLNLTNQLLLFVIRLIMQSSLLRLLLMMIFWLDFFFVKKKSRQAIRHTTCSPKENPNKQISKPFDFTSNLFDHVCHLWAELCVEVHVDVRDSELLRLLLLHLPHKLRSVPVPEVSKVLLNGGLKM